MQNPANFPRFSGLTVLAVLAALSGSADQAAAAYLASAHGGNSVPGAGVLRSSVSGKFAVGNCGHCHEQHASIDGSEPAPANGPARYLLLDNLAGNAACNHCHDTSGQNNADNIASQIGKTYRHDPNSANSPSDDFKPRCDICHDSHEAQKGNHQEAVDGNTAQGPLLSVAGRSVSTWTTGFPAGPGTEAMGTANLNALAEPITYEYELCFRCHINNQLLAAPNPNLDVGLQFNPNHYAVHPVATESLVPPQWKNAWLRGNLGALLAPWNLLDAKMHCSDCHGSETLSDPQGPHGSNNQYMLKYIPGGNALDNLCLRCHVNPATNSSWVDNPGYPAPNTALMIGDHSLTQHQYHPTNNPLGCLACHGGIGNTLASNIHGANYLWPPGGGIGKTSTAFLLPSGNPTYTITQNYYIGTDTAGSRYCAASCHVNDLGTGYIF